MELVAFLLIASVAIAVAIAVTVVSRTILARQEQLARRIEQMAGIQQIERVYDKMAMPSFAKILEEHTPASRLRLLAVSGGSVLRNYELLSVLLRRGVRIQILLLNPKSEGGLYGEHTWLLEETKASLNLLRNLSKYPGDAHNLEVRFYQQPMLEMLMFVDDDWLFLSSYLPVYRQSRLVYAIKRGEQSIYNLYEEAFQFLWENSYYTSSWDTREETPL
jgi:hypothetical protein